MLLRGLYDEYISTNVVGFLFFQQTSNVNFDILFYLEVIWVWVDLSFFSFLNLLILLQTHF